MLGIRPGSLFTPKVLDGVEVKFFHIKLGKPFLSGAGFVHGDVVMLKQERDKHKFIGTKGSRTRKNSQQQVFCSSSFSDFIRTIKIIQSVILWFSMCHSTCVCV